jgi:hypothetical protein
MLGYYDVGDEAKTFSVHNLQYMGSRGRVVVKAVCYKPEGRGFESRLGPGIYSDSNRNEYQKQKNNVSSVLSAASA